MTVVTKANTFSWFNNNPRCPVVHGVHSKKLSLLYMYGNHKLITINFCFACLFVQKTIENGGDFSEALPHDVASLLKQFFRELPEPLLTNHLHDHFLKCLLLGSKNEQTMAILLLCILLPVEHLYTLQYFVKFMAKVAGKSEESKMGTANLAIVLTPNLMNLSGKKESGGNSEKLLKEQTLVVQMLLESSREIGLVSHDILCEAKDSNSNEVGLSSGDELDGEKVALRGRSRPTSISGLLKDRAFLFKTQQRKLAESCSKQEFSRAFLFC